MALSTYEAAELERFALMLREGQWVDATTTSWSIWLRRLAANHWTSVVTHDRGMYADQYDIRANPMRTIGWLTDLAAHRDTTSNGYAHLLYAVADELANLAILCNCPNRPWRER